MCALPVRKWTPQDYFDHEQESPIRHEYLDGEVYALSGASEQHNLIVWNVASLLHRAFAGRPCRAYVNDMRVRAADRAKGRAYFYPDLVAVCGPPELSPDGDLETLMNPTAIFEVLSPSTERFDRGEKFIRYRGLPSLQEYVLIAQDRALVERFRRQPNGEWLLTTAEGLEASIELPSIEAALRLADVYERADFTLSDPLPDSEA